MSTVEEKIKKEIESLLKEEKPFYKLISSDSVDDFCNLYQDWYSRAKKIVEALAPDRLEEFLSYYLIDPKRKSMTNSNYVIQDYSKSIFAPEVGADIDFVKTTELWNTKHMVRMRILSQMHILASTRTRIDSIQRDVIGHLFAELQDKELEAASSQLLKISPRAAGVLAGVVLGCHLQRAATNHEIKLSKKTPAILDLNNSLKKFYDLSIYRKIQLLDVLRNKCSDQKGSDPTKDEVIELIDGVKYIIKSVF